MWEISRGAGKLAAGAILVLASLGVEAKAETNFINQNISGFNLPGVSLPSGSDEVRAADGTTCRSAVGGNGAYVDVGVIGNPEMDNTSASFSAYGRIVMPLGATPKRVDCTRLYDLEIQRLEMELKLAQMGLAQGISPVTESSSSSHDGSSDDSASDEPSVVASNSDDNGNPAWVDEGWSKEGLKK